MRPCLKPCTDMLHRTGTRPRCSGLAANTRDARWSCTPGSTAPWGVLAEALGSSEVGGEQ